MHDRFRLWLPAQIDGVGEETLLAIGHDMSQKGSMMVVGEAIDVGTSLVVNVKIPPDGDETLTLKATVLRCEANEADPQGMWRHRVALEFDEASPRLEELLREHMQHLEGMAETGEQNP